MTLKNLKGISVFCLSMIFVAPFLAEARTWNLNDVSILNALPHAGENADVMLSPGELLPHDVYAKHPVALVPTDGTIDKVYTNLRVIGVRIDAEQRQIRMTWQPVVWNQTTHAFGTEDRAAHTFYILSTIQLKLFLQEWAALGGETGRRELGVHPGFSGPKGTEFRQKLNRLLAKFCGRRSLIQYTSMELVANDDWWRFGGLGYTLNRTSAKKEWNPLTIAGLNNKNEDFFTFTSNHNEMKGQLHFGDDDKNLPLAKLATGLSFDTWSSEYFESAIDNAYKFQNPKLFTPLTLDCASCHFAHPAQFWIEKTAPNLKPALASVFQNPNPQLYDLSNKTIGSRSTRMLRAFGYFGSEPAINQRVINESALSADYLNSIDAGKLQQ